MIDIERLNYVSTERFFGGIIVELSDAGVIIDLKGRLGQMKLPRRMVICQEDLQVGQEVGFVMSYPEVLDVEPNHKYVESLNESKRRQAIKQEKYNN